MYDYVNIYKSLSFDFDMVSDSFQRFWKVFYSTCFFMSSAFCPTSRYNIYIFLDFMVLGSFADLWWADWSQSVGRYSWRCESGEFFPSDSAGRNGCPTKKQTWLSWVQTIRRMTPLWMKWGRNTASASSRADLGIRWPVFGCGSDKWETAVKNGGWDCGREARRIHRHFYPTYTSRAAIQWL